MTKRKHVSEMLMNDLNVMMKKLRLEKETLAIDTELILSKTCLCNDLVTAILTRLPVKSVLRFTCVSKSWNSLIHDPTFINAHNKIQKERPQRNRYLLYMPNDPRTVSPFVSFKHKWAERCFTLKNPFHYYEVVGYCEGLLLYVTSPDSRLCLWNPLLQTFKILPLSPSEKTPSDRLPQTSDILQPSPFIKIGIERPFTQDPYAVFGLGYSCKNDDHIIVKITYASKTSPLSNKVEIYSLKLDSWKSIDCTAPALADGQIGAVFLNGCVNWYAARVLDGGTRCFTMMWFNIDKELFGVRMEYQATSFNMGLLLSKHIHLRDVEEFRRCMKIPKECEKYYGELESLWKMKAFACENSSFEVWLNKRELVENVMTFDGESLLSTGCEDLISFLGFPVRTPWEKREEEEEEGMWQFIQGYRIFSVSESLMLLGHPKTNQYHC